MAHATLGDRDFRGVVVRAAATPAKGDLRITIEEGNDAGEWEACGASFVLSPWQCGQILLVMFGVDPVDYAKLPAAEQEAMMLRIMDLVNVDPDVACRSGLLH